eukprot:TRINITY_DN1977_c0_g1_i1.p1 TRINITY_DN1977_c0_g1~~TRINITY_DN1977_c0_g1_i1.p1  ORF type:complete len:653 (+),score=180.00 TRINITY_DN1977_c0_g1_i1:282-2240(+)
MTVDERPAPISNPLPPPPRPPPSKSSGNGNATPFSNLSNADFRRMVMETPRRVEENSKERPRGRNKHAVDDDEESHRHSHRRHRPKPKEEEKHEEPEQPKYRDRAKERREDQNPDYEPADLGSLHAVAPPGTVDLRTTDAHKISIENSKYLGGDVEHTHLVKGLDYALLHKVRSEIDKKPESETMTDGKPRAQKEDQVLTFRTAAAKSIYQWIVNPQSMHKPNEMFLPGRTAFLYQIGDDFYHDIPTTVHRSKADCPSPQECVAVGVDSSVLERIAKIMSYLRLGSSGKILKKKKKEKAENRGKLHQPLATEDANDDDKQTNGARGQLKKSQNKEMQPLPPPKNHMEGKDRRASSAKAEKEEDDIFEGEGTDYIVRGKNDIQSPISEDMEESPRDVNRPSYFDDSVYGPALPTAAAGQDWQQYNNGYDAAQGPALPEGYQGEWQQYPSLVSEPGQWLSENLNYADQHLHSQVADYSAQIGMNLSKDPRFMTQEEKDRGLGSVFKRDDQRLQQRREKDAREKDPNFISESYSECYPGYQEYNQEIADSDDEADLTKMDMGGRAKGRLHRWDFETEEEWAKYNEQKEAMPKAAFQFGVKMQDGRKTRKQNKDQKLTNELHKINKILERKKREKAEAYEDDHFDDEIQPGKRHRL